MRKLLLAATVLTLSFAAKRVQGQGYPPPGRLAERLRTLTTQFKSTATLQSLAKSPGGHDVWVLTLSRTQSGSANSASKPALAIVAGVEGSHLAGTELALQLAEKLLTGQSRDSLARMLDAHTIYILPLINPDAYAQATGTLKYERSGNGRPTDDDRDGRVDEDGPEDLNGDGLITTVRIEDPTGQYMVSKADARLLVKADPTKGEQGRYRLITEGVDNDKDGQHNEDGPGGINLNKNFSYDYDPFKPGTGEFPVSETENRALIDWFYATPSVYAILTFGPSNNLTEPFKFDKSKTTPRIIKGWLEKDVAVNDQVSKLYLAAGLKDAPTLPAQRGDFPQWAYFHFGKLSFSTPGWWVPRVDAPKTEAAKDTAKTGKPGVPPALPGGGDTKPGEGSDDVTFLKWASTNNTAAFMDWKPITHPDFPAQKAEVGGLVPFARLNPPANLLAEAADKQLNFIVNLTNAMPQLELVNVKTEVASAGLTRITADLHNRGLLPTQAELAERVRYLPKIKVSLTVGNGQKIITGRPVQLLRETIPGNGVVQLTWLVSGTGNVTLEAASPSAGTARTTIKL
ncbi:MAG: M14 family metallopeptidase [Cytophagaceae bacterium]|nr:M14 family metallopeptidase [Cytophagaceae bacterium]